MAKCQILREESPYITGIVQPSEASILRAKARREAAKVSGLSPISFNIRPTVPKPRMLVSRTHIDPSGAFRLTSSADRIV